MCLETQVIKTVQPCFSHGTKPGALEGQGEGAALQKRKIVFFFGENGKWCSVQVVGDLVLS